MVRACFAPMLIPLTSPIAWSHGTLNMVVANDLFGGGTVFSGLTDTTPITSLSFSINGPETDILNFQVGYLGSPSPFPEPSSLALLATGTSRPTVIDWRKLGSLSLRRENGAA